MCSGNGCSFDQSFSGSALALEGGRLFELWRAISTQGRGIELACLPSDDVRWVVYMIRCGWKGSSLLFSENSSTLLPVFLLDVADAGVAAYRSSRRASPVHAVVSVARLTAKKRQTCAILLG